VILNFLVVKRGNCGSQFKSVLTMVYNTQNYWISELCPSSCILKTKKNTFRKLASVPSSGKRRETPNLLRMPSSGILRSVALVRTDVSEERSAFSALELDLPLNCPLTLDLLLTVLCAPSYCSVLFSTVLLNCFLVFSLVGFGVWPKVSSCRSQRDYRLLP
jgi:hypothetical protein